MPAGASTASNTLEILIVDDDPLVCERLEVLLATHSMRSISVDTLEQAREATRAIYFPLIVLDRHLGDGDGADLCREYRARLSGKRVRILMMSAKDSPEEAASALAAGADDFVSKRAGDDVLISRVKQLYAIACGHDVVVPNSDREHARLQSLEACDVLDTEIEAAYEDITRLASIICKTPIALISLVDGKRQWFKSRFGLDASETPREHAFCSHAIQKPEEMFVVTDTQLDPRFANNPLVTGDPNIRFYAGAPLVTSDGHALGTVCVIDREPRVLDATALEGLRALARQAMQLLEQRKIRKELERAMLAQRAADSDLQRSEALFREAYENAPIGIALVSMQGQWLRVNRSLCEILGYSSAELLRTTFQAILHSDDFQRESSPSHEVLAGSIRSYEMEKRYVHKLGHTVWVKVNVSLVRDEHNTPLFFVAHLQDITERKRLEHQRATQGEAA